MKLILDVKLEQLENGKYACQVAPNGVISSDAWGAHGEGRTMSEALMKAAWVFERLEEANPSLLHNDYPARLLDIQSASDFSPWRPPR